MPHSPSPAGSCGRYSPAPRRPFGKGWTGLRYRRARTRTPSPDAPLLPSPPFSWCGDGGRDESTIRCSIRFRYRYSDSCLRHRKPSRVTNISRCEPTRRPRQQVRASRVTGSGSLTARVPPQPRAGAAHHPEGIWRNEVTRLEAEDGGGRPWGRGSGLLRSSASIREGAGSPPEAAVPALPGAALAILPGPGARRWGG